MFLPVPGGVAQALDAANGDLRWDYWPSPAGGGPARTTPMRNLAIYGDRIYTATAGARLIALNARTGAVVWEHQVADSKLGYTYSSGPIVVKGMIVAGMMGGSRYKNDVCFISAHDSQTGKEIWRTSTSHGPANRAATRGVMNLNCEKATFNDVARVEGGGGSGPCGAPT
jgi:alcohol dehydrogenase (cytochrome c)